MHSLISLADCASSSSDLRFSKKSKSGCFRMSSDDDKKACGPKSSLVKPK